jgi:hypothetical protein
MCQSEGQILRVGGRYGSVEDLVHVHGIRQKSCLNELPYWKVISKLQTCSLSSYLLFSGCRASVIIEFVRSNQSIACFPYGRITGGVNKNGLHENVNICNYECK